MGGDQVNKLNLFIPITKVDEENRLVYGVLAAEELDNSGEIFDYESSKPEFEKWSEDQFTASNGLSKGNVRAMHTSIAAGKLTDISYDDTNKAIEGVAKVVDDGEWQKVLEGVYTGFSMGGRYAKRWQDNGNTRYTAQPVEMSLVDKPCIKSALFAGMTKSFMLQKADGSVEERLFKTGTDNMDYVPTNDEILPVAQSLAKAAGKTDADWLEYSDAARDQLIAEKSAASEVVVEKPAAKADAPEHTDEDCKAGDDCDKCAAMKVDAVEPTPAPVEADAGATVEPEATAEKADVPELQQGWQAKDGSFHLKKADALAHNDKLAKGDVIAEPTLAEQLAVASAAVAEIASGDVVIPAGEETVVKSIDVRLTEMAGFLKDTEVVEKSIYNVSRTANAMKQIAGLYVSVHSEAAKEGDGSAVPASLLAVVEALGNTLIDMATEEVGELMERLREKDTESDVADTYYYTDYYCNLAASTLGLEKADATAFFDKAISISGKDQARLQKIHDHSIALGAACAKEDDAAAAADVDADAATEKMAKAAGFEDGPAFIADLQKRAAELDVIKPQVEQLVKDIVTLKATPRGPAPRSSVVEKGEDIRGGPAPSGHAPGSIDERVAKAMAELQGLSGPELSRALIKISQSQGVSVSLHT